MMKSYKHGIENEDKDEACEIVKVQEELVALYHTPAERAIYEGAASSRRGPRSVPW